MGLFCWDETVCLEHGLLRISVIETVWTAVLRHLAVARPCVGQRGFICCRNDVVLATGEQTGTPGKQL